MASQSNGMLDCLIIGGGPAGLTAAVYLARYRRSVVVYDDGKSRAKLIPESHNYPGFSGIHGADLLKTLRHQARRYGAHIEHAHIEGLRKEGDGNFTATAAGRDIRAQRVIMATGIVDESPHVPGLREAIYHGALRYCPICDGYEAMDQKIGVLGTLDTACHKSLFLRTYSRNVVVLAADRISPVEEGIAEQLERAGIVISEDVVDDIERDGEKIVARLANGARIELDVLYPALGCEVRSKLGLALGANANDVGCLVVDDHQRTSVPGLYAAGDVVSDLHQISVGTGHAAIAATAVHNSLPRNFR